MRSANLLRQDTERHTELTFPKPMCPVDPVDPVDSTNRHSLPRELYFSVRHREACMARKILKGSCRCPRWRKGQRWHKRAKKCRCTKRRRWDSDEKTCVCRDADRQGYLWDLQRNLKFKILSINDLLNAERTRKTYF